ncbi:MAG TPA: sigma-70 region 4 domain-containing protein [Puia sp.]|nr:sigma-70 region 4 domain-containing protein [Puia sp.]
MEIKRNDISRIVKRINYEEFRTLIPNEIIEVLELFYCNNLSQKEIMEKLNVSKGKVRHHLSKGKYLIKKKAGGPYYERAFKILYGDSNRNNS